MAGQGASGRGGKESGPPQCMKCSRHHWTNQKCRDRCSECWGYHAYQAACDGPGPPPGQPMTVNPSLSAGYGQPIQYASAFAPTLASPGPGWFIPSKHRQGASGPQEGKGSKPEKRKRDTADNADFKTGSGKKPQNSKQVRHEKRVKAAIEAEEARQQLHKFKSQTAETDKLQAELLELVKSGANPARLAEVVGLLEQAHVQREMAKKEEQDKQVKEHEEAVQKLQRLEEQLRQVQEQVQQARVHLMTVRARVDPALLSTLRAVDLPIRTAESNPQDQELADAAAKAAVEHKDEDMNETG